MNDLSKRQRAILAYIRGCDLSPSIREIRDDCQLSTTSLVTYHLNRLEALGYITRDPKKSRSIRVVGDDRANERLRHNYRELAKELSKALAEAARWRARAEALEGELKKERDE